MSANADKFDAWIRDPFVALNTQLEDLYARQADPGVVIGVGDDIKQQIHDQGRALIIPLVDEGNTDEGFDRAFNLLGNLGLWFAALRRHEVTNPAREDRSPFPEASALGMHIAASIGVAPRFATSHLGTHNFAIDGRAKTFTLLEDEKLFLDLNTIGILAYKKAADALKRVLPLGVSHPVARVLLADAAAALGAVAAANDELFATLDVKRFFFSVRPYYKPYRVGRHEYRGANAGDFAGINEIDLLLGLCRANDAYYSQILVDKMLFMTPEDQASLRDTMRRRSLLDEFAAAATRGERSAALRGNLSLFLDVCRRHGETARQHHDMLVERFIAGPSSALPPEQLGQITASGPPLDVLMRSLEALRDRRLAAPRDDMPTAHGALAQLRSYLDAIS